jgi:hypothetical protein
MSSLLLNLRNVPDDEADEVRALLDAHRVGYYETRPSRWGISAGAIWIADAEQALEARQLMDGYQTERRTRVQAEFARDGNGLTWWSVLHDQPLRVLLTLIATALLLGLVALPVLLISH